MTEPRYDWTINEVLAVIERPFHDTFPPRMHAIASGSIRTK